MNTAAATYSEPRRTLDGGWYRHEITTDGYPPVRVWLTGPTDDSYTVTARPYNADCAWCYLGAAHSANAHKPR